jgi:hypothetical protein
MIIFPDRWKCGPQTTQATPSLSAAQFVKFGRILVAQSIPILEHVHIYNAPCDWARNARACLVRSTALMVCHNVLIYTLLHHTCVLSLLTFPF